MKTGRGVRQGCCLSSILFNVYSEFLTKEALEGFGDLKIGGKIIHAVKYADDLVLLAKEEKALEDMIDKLIEIGKCYGMEMNMEKTKVMRISRQPLPVKIILLFILNAIMLMFYLLFQSILRFIHAFLC